MSSKVAKFRHQLDLSPFLAGREVVATAICHDGTLAILATNPESKELPFDRIEQPESVTFPRSTAAVPYPATLMRFDTEFVQTVELPSTVCAFRKYPGETEPHMQIVENANKHMVLGHEKL